MMLLSKLFFESAPRCMQLHDIPQDVKRLPNKRKRIAPGDSPNYIRDPLPCSLPFPPLASRILIKGGWSKCKVSNMRGGEGACMQIRHLIDNTLCNHPILPVSHNRIAHSRRPRHDANPQRENDQTKRNGTTDHLTLEDRQKRQEANSSITRTCLKVVLLITLVFVIHGLLSPRSRSIAVDPQQLPDRSDIGAWCRIRQGLD
jgi:hypothetical protein